MENETKYPLIIIGVAMLALVAFNYDDLFTGNAAVDGKKLQNSPTLFPQEKSLFVRTIDVPDKVVGGRTIDIIVRARDGNDLIKINKEKILIYEMRGSIKRFKNQITYPRCNDGTASACNEAAKSISVPLSWRKGDYVVQVEREGRVGDKVVTEVVGRSSFEII